MLISEGHYLQNLNNMQWKELNVTHSSSKSALRKWSHIYLCSKPNLYSFPLWKVINCFSIKVLSNMMPTVSVTLLKKVMSSAAEWTRKAPVMAATHDLFSTTFSQGPVDHWTTQDHWSVPSVMLQETVFVCTMFLISSDLTSRWPALQLCSYSREADDLRLLLHQWS